MKTKLRLLLLTILLSVSYLQAQTKTDVWDFGAAELDPTLYNNNLTAATINSWYPAGTVAGSTGVNLPTATLTLTPSVLTLTTGGSDRLYTNNTAITRVSSGNLGTTDTNYTARYYCNGAANNATSVTTATSRYFTFTLNADDEVTVIASTESAGNSISVSNMSTGTQNETFPVTVSGAGVTSFKFVAKAAGNFKIVSLVGKGNYYRIYRKPVTPVTLTGNLDVTAAPGIPSNYSVLFTNNFTGKTYTAPVVSGAYSVSVPSGFTYKMSLVNANGFIISNGENFTVTDAATVIHDISILKVDLYTVTGAVTGLATKISSAVLTYTPSVAKTFVPKPVITTATSTYTVDLEPSIQYTITATGVNDYEILANTITIPAANTVQDITFTAKPVYPVTINTTGLNATQIASLTLTFTNLNESGYVYTFAPNTAINLRNGTYAITYIGLNASEAVMTLTSNLKVTNAATAKTLDFTAPAITTALPYEAALYVGTDKTYKTINAALAAVTRMTSRNSTQRVTIMIDPGNYEEMLDVTQANVTLKNAAVTPNINLSNKGVDIDLTSAVRITSYYGHGYDYYSMKNNKWDADVLRVNKENGYLSSTNIGAGTTTYWNATVIISASGFEANDIIFENSYNQYISKKESQDIVVKASGNKGDRPTNYGNTAVQNKSFVERAAAFAVKNNIDKVVLNKCRVVGRQDSFFGGTGARVVVYKGVLMGGTDYLFGGMNAVFYQTDLAMNTSEDPNDVSYITAPQQQTATGRGYLMYECKVTSAIPGTETASLYRSKPGYFGRPWQAITSEVVFYNTTIETTNNPNGQSLILPVGWNNSLSGAESAKMYEYGTIEQSGVNNTASRAGWASPVLTSPTLTDGTAITILNFTKGTDNWDPIPVLKAADPLGTKTHQAESAVTVSGYKNNITVSNVKSNTTVSVYSLNGALVKSFETAADANFEMKAGIWIVVVKAADGQKSVKLMTY